MFNTRGEKEGEPGTRSHVRCHKRVLAFDIKLETCVGYRKLKEALQGHFKFATFRPGLLEALLPVVHGEDVFVRMPTGVGKSLCIV